MRALLVTELFPPAVGGSAVLFHGIYSRLANTDVTVLTDVHTSPPGPAGSFPGQVVGREIATAEWGVRHGAAQHHLRVARYIRELMRRSDGLVHAARALPEGVAALLSRAMGGPDYVCWAHGEDLATASWSRELTLVTRAVYSGAWGALANSESTARMLEDIGVSRRKVTVVYPAVDAARFHPGVDGTAVRERYARPGDVLLLSVGRLQRRKGHDRVIEALHMLRDDAAPLRYVIAGAGEERQRLEALVRDFDLRGRVVFAGIVPDAELPAYYAACDVFVHPNRIDDRDVEGFGIVFLEAAATGKPVVGGNSGGVPEAVEGDVTGLLVDGDDVEDVARAIRRLASDPALRERFGSAGRARVEQRFTWEQAAATVSALQDRWANEQDRRWGMSGRRRSGGETQR
jgi:phosphatidylinositol alpha-1,6-mannosyltransferase